MRGLIGREVGARDKGGIRGERDRGMIVGVLEFVRWWEVYAWDGKEGRE